MPQVGGMTLSLLKQAYRASMRFEPCVSCLMRLPWKPF